MADDKIKYSDIIEKDTDAIEYLILQLDELNQEFKKATAAIKDGATSIAKSMKDLNGATASNRAAIDESAAAADRLEKAQKELAFAISDTGKQVAWLKQQTKDANAQSVDMNKRTLALAGSYDKLKLQVKDLTNRYKALSAEERAGEKGDRLLLQLTDKKTQLAILDEQMKVHVQQTLEVKKAEERLNFLRSEEGQRLIALKKEISDIVSGRNEEKTVIDKVAAAQEKLKYAMSDENMQIASLNNQIREANRIAKLQTIANESAVGSYNQLAAQYELNKIKLNAMSQEERRAVDVGQKLEAETLRIYKQMIILQESTGKYTLSVGHYEKAWNGLGNAMNQIVREIPSMTMGTNMFFLAISNNIPILIDELQRVKEKNALLRAEGKPTQNVMNTLAKSIFGWQTALILVITALSMNGEAILEWITKLIKGFDHTMSFNDALNNMRKELKNTNGDYGNLITTYKKLQSEWSKLGTLKEQKQWIKDNTSEFNKLDVSIRNVSEAEEYLVNMTDSVIEAMRLRAKAAAAMKLASEKYEQALLKQQEAESFQYEYVKDEKTGKLVKKQIDIKTQSLGDKLLGLFGINTQKQLEENIQGYVSRLDKEYKALEKEGDQYTELFTDLNNQANNLLGKFQRKHKTDKTRTPRERDLTDIIYRNDIGIRKKYEASITALQNDEYAKRRKELMDAVMNENNQLKEKYRKNEAYLADYNNKYKKLTDEQVKMIQEQQAMIKKTLINNGLKLSLQLEQVEKDRRIKQLEINRNYDDLTLDETVASLEEERKLQIQYLSREFELTADTNRKLRQEGDDSARSEEDIRREFYNKQISMIELYNQKILELKQGNIDLQLEIVKKGSQEELNLLLKKNELERQMALSQNRAKPASQRQSEENINASFDKKGAQITGSFEMTGLGDAQAQAEAEFNIVKRSEYQITKFKLEQERDRWVKQIALAKAGALDWSDAQIAAAEATVKGIDRQLSELDDITGMIGEKGLGGALLTKLGFNDKQIKSLEDATSIFLEQLQAIAQAEVELAQIQVEKAQERVEAAKSAYDAEIEARNNGYANNVATAKKELQQEKKNQAEKEKLLAQAQKRQEAINTVVQASSLITASANLWSSFSSIPIVGPALALAAIATMWTSFAVAKIKANQVAKAQSQEYGEGGLEFLDGGSHASGNDIDLQTKNSKGKNMRAEGGEAMAIINKRSTRRYRKQLPDIINALNKGTFNEKYIKAFDKGETLQAQIIMSSQVDLSKLERDIEAIRKQGNDRMLISNDGTIIEIKGNVKRIYR